MGNNVEFIRNHSGMKAEGGVVPRFYVDAEEDPVASANAGRLICHSSEKVEVIFPGNPWNKPVFKVTDEHRQRWPEAYAKFKAGQEQSPDGTPLEEWPILKRAQVLELKSLGFSTVEQLAEMPDLAMQKIGMGGRALKERASAFLDDADRIAVTERLTAQKDRDDAHITSLQNQVTQLQALVDTLHSQMQTFQNKAPEIQTAVPYHTDPVALAQMGQKPEAPATSSLDALATPKRRGRPPKSATEAA